MDTEQTFQLEKIFPNACVLKIDGDSQNINPLQQFKFVNLSESVKKIWFSDIFIEKINYPKKLEKLTLWNCNLHDEHMINLPDGLLNLTCPNNYITKLDNLPIGLKKLDCSNNEILYLDNLPESLEFLNCSYNKIINLDNLPNGLIYLDCSHCEITNLDSLPDTLEQVFAKFNDIKSIKRLPTNLTRANFTNNPLIVTPKCHNSLILLNYSLDAEKASTSDKIVQFGYKFAYGTYHTAKYTTYGIGIGIGIGLLGVVSLVPLMIKRL